MMAMGDMYDSTRQASIPADAEIVMGYVDGPESEWTAADWEARAKVAQLRLSVLANGTVPGFDVERGNAPTSEVATACAVRHGNGEWSVIYLGENSVEGMTTALAEKDLRWVPASEWPAPGVYLGAADWTGAAHLDPVWAPVPPVFVQYQHTEEWDRSVTYGDFPVVPAKPEPAPVPVVHPVPAVPEGYFTVTVPEVSEGNPGPSSVSGWVAVVQSVLNGRHGEHLSVDGRFGAETDAAVRKFQEGAKVAADGVVGPVTVGALFSVTP